MPSRVLTAVWAGLDFALLAAGVISVVFSIIWRNSSLLMNFVLFDMNLTGESNNTLRMLWMLRCFLNSWDYPWRHVLGVFFGLTIRNHAAQAAHNRFESLQLGTCVGQLRCACHW